MTAKTNATTCIRRADWAIVWDEARGGHAYRRGADIAFAGGRIVHAGGRYDGAVAREIDGTGFLAMPGLINVHWIDILVNDAGITSPQRVMEVDAATYERIVDINMRGTLHMTQAVVPAMRAQKSGAIVNMSSVSAQRGGGVFGGSHYSAAKGAVLGYTKACARELGPDNIRVNAICPSLINTDITGGALTPDRLAAIRDDPDGPAGRSA